jgi:cytochrome b561
MPDAPSATPPAATAYTRTAISLHWLLAVLIAATFLFGLYMTSLELSPTKLRYYNWHKWAGVTILALSAARLLWRLAHRPPTPPAAAAWQRGFAQATHGALYALFFAVPLVGWAYSSAAGFPVVMFGVLPLPDFVSPDRELAAAIKPWHGRLAWALSALAAVHVAGALKHHWIDRDGLLSRMRPYRRRAS